ncbi:somatostatin receptor type 5 [Biomphalaria pfeifferi]|uniref:Somatostatin receptor type 5 n=1 Tax=Biomphalaria pfeifferi TaxID=112525 RepID=A0AAD8FGI7_BIOPF|nr:somatostatin receptor type 5 [Biomphalaria pfeifferi]
MTSCANDSTLICTNVSAFTQSDVSESTIMNSSFSGIKLLANTLSLEKAVIITAVSNFVALFGFVGNILNVVVLARSRLDCTTTIILRALAVADLLYLGTSPLRNIHFYFKLVSPPLATIISSYVDCYGLTLNSTFLTISMTHIVVIAVERVLAVYFPLKVSKWITSRRMSIISLGVYITWFVISVPLFFFKEVTWVYSAVLNETVPITVYTKFYRDNPQIIEWLHLYVMTMLIGPVFSSMVFICCLAIGVKLYLASRKRLKMASAHKAGISNLKLVNLKIARMLFVVCLIYLTAGLPLSMLRVLDAVITSLEAREIKFHFSVLVWAINCSSNFVVYVFMSDKFNQSFRALFCRKCQISKQGR